jgi:hypothetical protein
MQVLVKSGEERVCPNRGPSLGAAAAEATPSKLERLIATILRSSPQTLRETAQSFRSAQSAPEAARSYIACLLETNVARVEAISRVAPPAQRAPPFVGRYVMSIDGYGDEHDIGQSSLEIRANGSWRIGPHYATGDLVRGGLVRRDSASGPWRVLPSGQIDLNAPEWPVPFGVSLALVYDPNSRDMSGCLWTAGEGCQRVTAQRQ